MEILRSSGLAFEVLPANIDEPAAATADGPRATAIRTAESKALAVQALRPDAAVLAADTVVVLNGRLLGKPGSTPEAMEMLGALRGKTHSVITGVALVSRGGVTSGAEETRVHFRRYSVQEAAAYAATPSPYDKAGAYGIQDRPFSPAEGYDGCYLNVVGLPLCLVEQLIRDGGLLAGRSARIGCPGHSQA
jgi:MAF protein